MTQTAKAAAGRSQKSTVSTGRMTAEQRREGYARTEKRIQKVRARLGE